MPLGPTRNPVANSASRASWVRVDSSGNQNLPPDIVQWLWFGWCWKPLQDALGYQLMPLMVWVVGLGHQFF